MRVVVAVKRDHRKTIPPDWPDLVLSVAGVTVEGEPAMGRLIVDGSADAIAEVKAKLGNAFHIEELQLYKADPPQVKLPNR